MVERTPRSTRVVQRVRICAIRKCPRFEMVVDSADVARRGRRLASLGFCAFEPLVGRGLAGPQCLDWRVQAGEAKAEATEKRRQNDRNLEHDRDDFHRS